MISRFWSHNRNSILRLAVAVSVFAGVGAAQLALAPPNAGGEPTPSVLLVVFASVLTLIAWKYAFDWNLFPTAQMVPAPAVHSNGTAMTACAARRRRRSRWRGHPARRS